MSRPSRKDDAGRCPVCGRSRDGKFKPFCSRRCADIDLARWLDGRYVIPGKETGEDAAELPNKRREDEE